MDQHCFENAKLMMPDDFITIGAGIVSCWAIFSIAFPIVFSLLSTDVLKSELRTQVRSIQAYKTEIEKSHKRAFV